MALSLEEYRALDNASLVKLFNDNSELWAGMAKRAYDFTYTYVQPNPVRVDDVIMALVPALRVTKTLTDYLASKKLRQKYWPTWFGDLILEQNWNNLRGGT